METIYRHTQVSRATVGGMGIAWAAVVWWSLRVSDPVPVTTAVLVGSVLVLFSTLTVIVRETTWLQLRRSRSRCAAGSNRELGCAVRFATR